MDMDMEQAEAEAALAAMGGVAASTPVVGVGRRGLGFVPPARTPRPSPVPLAPPGAIGAPPAAAPAVASRASAAIGAPAAWPPVHPGLVELGPAASSRSPPRGPASGSPPRVFNAFGAAAPHAEAPSGTSAVVDGLLQLELPSPQALAGRLDSLALAGLVVELVNEVKRCRREVDDLRSAVGMSAVGLLTGKLPQAAGNSVGQGWMPAVPMPGPALTSNVDNWAWGTGKDRPRDRSKSHDDRPDRRSQDDRADRRSRSRERRRRGDRREGDAAGRREREKSADREVRERDRAFVQDRLKRAQEDAVRDRKRLGVDVEEDKGKFRASCTFMGDRGAITSVGPWRKTSEKARQDGEELEAAFRSGGESAVQAAKIALLRRAAQEGGRDREAQYNPENDLKPNDTRFPYPTEIEGPSKVSSSLGGYRAVCTFPNAAKPTYEGAKPRKPIPVKCPWRMGPRARSAAEADAKALCDAFSANGDSAMQEAKRTMFKTADADATAARMGRGKDDTLQNIFKSGGVEGSADGARATASSAPPPREELPADTVEEDSKGRGADSRGVRAKCFFPNERQSTSGGGSAPIQITGPWRKRRSEVDADIGELRAAFKEGGLSAANAKRMAMLREQQDGPQSQPPPRGELSESDLASRYGKGFKLLAGLGFQAGSGLGAQSQGITTPVEAVDAEIALATASRHIGLGFADVAGLGAPSGD